MHKRVIEVGSLVWRHPSILTCLAVEDEVQRQRAAKEDAGAGKKLLRFVAGVSDGVERRVGGEAGVAEGILKDRLRLG